MIGTDLEENVAKEGGWEIREDTSNMITGENVTYIVVKTNIIIYKKADSEMLIYVRSERTVMSAMKA